jgi:hypothetical protein
MLKGDLTSTPLAPLLLQLAEDLSTGCLHVSDAEGDEALIYYKNGLVYAVSVPGRRPQLGAKLVSSGALAPEALADALEAQRTELQGWRLGELLVHLGYVDQPVVEAFVKEQVHDALWDLIRWTDGRWKFRKTEKTREDVAPPMLVADLLANLRERGVEWETISAIVHGPTAVPTLSARGGGAPETTLDADAWSMLCKIDGERSVAELARDCGYTLFEAGQVLVALVQAGLVDIDEDVDVVAFDPAPRMTAEPADDALYGATSVASALHADADADAAEAAEATEAADETDSAAEVEEELEDPMVALARLVTEVAASVRQEAEPVVLERVADEPSPVVLHPGTDQSFASSIARVSAALSDVLGPSPTADPYEVSAEIHAKRSRKPLPTKPQPTPESERRARVRTAAAAELAAAHALAEALRSAQAEEGQEESAPPEVFAEVVDLATVRRGAEEAARAAAEQEAARVEAERHAAEHAAHVEAERLAAEQEAARVEAERLAAEHAAQVEAERLAAEHAAQVEAERLAAEQETARVEAERLAAEQEAARVEAERLADEHAAQVEAERHAAQVEAERLAAEIAEAEDEAWSEYWQREADATDALSRQMEATALLIELSAQPIEVPVEEPPLLAGLEDVDADDLSELREPATVAAGYSAMSEVADTAALLRELSSLGVEDDPPPPTAHAPRPPQRPTAADAKKKKRGLFGR